MQTAREREPLTRARIAEVAVALIDAQGEQKFTMRRLAGALGVDPMAVYHHLPNRAAVIHEAIEAVIASCTLPDSSGPWTDRVRAICVAYRGLAAAHPGVFPLLCIHQHFVPSDHRIIEALLAALSDAGLNNQETVWAASAVLGYAAGFALDEVTGTHRALTEEERATLRTLPSIEFPATNRLMDAVLETDLDREFAFGLDIMLAGIAARAAG